MPAVALPAIPFRSTCTSRPPQNPESQSPQASSVIGPESAHGQDSVAMTRKGATGRNMTSGMATDLLASTVTVKLESKLNCIPGNTAVQGCCSWMDSFHVPADRPSNVKVAASLPISLG